MADTPRSPRVEACIQNAMEKYAGGSPGRDLTYYQNVHQDLAPLARELENALLDANARLKKMEQALASRPAEVDDEGLPPLPDHIEVGGEGWDIEDFKSEKTFTVDHLWQYARYAVVADRAQRGDGWISVDDRMPGKERCLAAYVNAAGKHRIIRAMYADQFQIDAGEDAIDQGNCEYNEADDTFYLKAGWLECIDNWDDYSSIYVTEGTVTHWRRLPAAPSHTTNKEG